MDEVSTLFCATSLSIYPSTTVGDWRIYVFHSASICFLRTYRTERPAISIRPLQPPSTQGRKRRTHHRRQNRHPRPQRQHGTDQLQFPKSLPQHIKRLTRRDPRPKHISTVPIREDQTRTLQQTGTGDDLPNPLHLAAVRDVPLRIEVDDGRVAEQALFDFGRRGVAADGTARIEDGPGDGDDGVGGGEGAEEGARGDALAGGGDGHGGDFLGHQEGLGEDVRAGDGGVVAGDGVDAGGVGGGAERAAVVGDGGFVELGDDELVSFYRRGGRGRAGVGGGGVGPERVGEPVLGHGGGDCAFCVDAGVGGAV